MNDARSFIKEQKKFISGITVQCGMWIELELSTEQKFAFKNKTKINQSILKHYSNFNWILFIFLCELRTLADKRKLDKFK